MPSSKFSKIERAMIKEFLFEKGRNLEIFSEKSDETFEFFSDETVSAETGNPADFFEKNLLRLKKSSENSKILENLFNSAENLRVNFYFNALGVYFSSRITVFKNSFCLRLPDDFFKISEDSLKNDSKFSAVLYFETESKIKGSSRNFFAVQCPVNQPLIEKKSLDLQENNENSLDFKVRRWISDFFRMAKNDSKIKEKIGSGLFLISAGSYFFSGENRKIGHIQGRKNAPQVIYLDEKRIVFASEKENMILSDGQKYRIELSFPLPHPINSRKIDFFCTADFFIENQEKTKICVSASISEIKAEDSRFLSEVKF